MKKLTAVLLTIALSATFFAGCAKTQQPISQNQANNYTFTDALDRQVEISSPQKVAVLTGSFAQVWSLAGGTLYGVTEDATRERDLVLPQGTVDLGKLDAPNVEKIIADGVDFVIMSSRRKEHVALQETFDKAGIKCAYFDINLFEDYLEMLKICTDITGKPDLYKQYGTDVKEQIEKAIARKKDGVSHKILFMRTSATLINAQNSESMGGVMLKDLGCTNIADIPGGVLDNLSIENIIKEDPEYIFVVTMGASEEKAMETLKKTLTSNPAWNGLSAVKNDKFIILPKELFHYKPNAKWGESYEMLADILYPAK